MRISIKELVGLRNSWVMLSRQNPHVANVFQTCIGDLDKVLNRALVAENSKLTKAAETETISLEDPCN